MAPSLWEKCHCNKTLCFILIIFFSQEAEPEPKVAFSPITTHEGRVRYQSISIVATLGFRESVLQFLPA